jgi:tetratricopeptide (TPR) repeat protein
MRYSFVADHFQYHASIYPIALISAVLWRWRPWPMLLVLPLAGLAFHQTRIYHDPLTLWLDTLGKNPNSWMVHTNLGKAFDAAGDAARSIAHHERALELAPHLPELHRNVGIVRMRQGRVEEALQAFQQAIEIDPTYPETYFSLGNHHLDRGEFEQAIAQYEKAIELAPEYAPAWANLGLAQLELRRLDDAIASLQRALELNPYLQGAQRSLHAARLMKSRGAPSGR